MIKNCKICDQEFKTKPSKVKRGHGIYCSKECRGVKEKGRGNPNWQGGKMEKQCLVCAKPFYVWRALRDVRKHCSVSCRGKTKSKQMSGDKHHNWKGGISPLHEKIRKSEEYHLWRVAVFIRDDYTCQMCRQKGAKLHAHHIKSFADFPELRFAIDNGVALCHNCHSKVTFYEHKFRLRNI